MKTPTKEDIQAAVEHGRFLRGAGALGSESRMLADLAAETQRLRRLADFGAVVLEVMESDKDWCAETVERLQREASVRGFADSDDEGFFKAKLP